jgi:electron transport complex protein RnfG
MIPAEHTDIPAMPSSASMIRALGTTAVIAGLLVVLVYQWTAPIIAENRRIALERAVFKVIPGIDAASASRVSYRLTPDGVRRLDDESTEKANLYGVYSVSGQLAGFALEAAAQGYQDVVRTLYGYVPDCECIVGFTVLETRETPGLGDKVETDPGFLANFDPEQGGLYAGLNADGTAVEHPIETVRHGRKTQPWQIDAISGATVTSNAIGNGLRDSTQRFLPMLARHLHELERRPE